MKNKQGFFLTKLLLCLLLIVTSFNYALKAEEPDDDGDNTVEIEEHVNGYIESKLDRGVETYYPEVSLYADDTLPSKYPNTDDPIQSIKNTYPASRNQNPFGTCWAFSSVGLMEFDLVKNHNYSKDSIDLSELQLVYNSFYSVVDPLKGTDGDTSTYNNVNTAGNNRNALTYLNHGGNFEMTMRRLSQWASPVTENKAQYPSNSSESSYLPDSNIFNELAYSDNSIYLKNAYLINISTNPEEVKKAIKTYGAVGISYYHDDNNISEYYKFYGTSSYAFYDNDHASVNHAVMIVGWDDNFSKTNFKTQPNSDGAWLIRNSWGDYYDYFWMSYETKCLHYYEAYDFDTGSYVEIQGGQTAYVFDVDANDYKYNYQLDGGLYLSYDTTTSAANIYKVQLKEDGQYDALKAINISLTSAQNVSYSVDIYTELTDKNNPTSGNKHEYVASGQTALNGLYTIELDEPIYLKPSSYYSIVVNFTNYTYVDIEYAYNGENYWNQYVKKDNNSYHLCNLSTNTYCVLEYYDETAGVYGNYSIKGFANDAYTLTYNYNDNNDTDNTSTILESGSNYTFPSEPTRDGYTFDGWYTAAEDGTIVSTSNTISQNTTVYAHWTKNETVDVTFDANEGKLDDESPKTKTYEVGKKYNTLPNASKEGYEFTGWYTSTTDNTRIDATSTVSKDITTLYARYTPNAYSIVFDSNGGTGTMSADDATYDVDTTLNENLFTKTGYSFKEWNTKTDGSGVLYKDKETVKNLTTTKGEIVTLYAQWTANNYIIKYDANGGSGNMNDTSATYDKSVTLLNNTYTKTNYTFTGWNTKANGSGTSYNNGDVVSNLTDTNNGTVTLYAQWARITHTVIFEPNGGSLPVTSFTKTVAEGGKYGTLPTPTRDGYTFDGWYTSNDGGDKITEDSIVGKFDIRLYAHWAAKDVTYNVVYKSNTKQLGTDTVTYKYGTTNKINAKEFNGYNTPVPQTISWSSASTETITFVYTPIEYTIEYELNGGTNNESNPASYTIESDEITLSNPTKTGYTFDGWYLDADFKTESNSITAGSTGEKTFYAKWSKETYEYTIKYVSDSGKDLGSATKSIEYGSTEAITAPTKAGYNTPNSQTIDWSSDSREIIFTYRPIEYTITYHDVNGADNTANKVSYTIEDNSVELKDIKLEGHTFNGWFSDEKLENKITSINTKQLKNLDVYASWTVNEYKLTYSIDTTKGGLDNGQASEVTLEYGSKYGTLPNVTAVKGYKFIGWYTESEGGQEVSENTTMKAGNTTIYARFEEVTYKAYKLTFNGNGGTASQDFKEVKETYEVGQLPNAIKEGYTFAGWYTSVDGGSKVTDTYVMPSSDLTIYAHWNVNSYKLTFVSDGETLEEKNVNYNDSLGELPTPEDKLGYEFAGWFNGDTEYSADSKMPASELTLTAHFKALEKPSITFNGNGGTSSVDGGQVNFDGTLVGTLPTATRKGYTFVGWYTEANGGIKLENDSNFKDISEIYAHWTINSYTISFDSNGGNEVASISVEYDSTYFDKLPTPTKDKYKFLGWYTSDDQAVNENSKIFDSDITLYAKWEYIPQAYTLTLVYNDGTSKKDERSIIENNEYGELPTPTRDGYVFDGWYDSLSDGAKVTAKTTMDSKDVTIYAHWIRINRTIKLNANLEGVDDLSIYVDDDNHFIGNLPTLAKNGKYNFDGWYTKALDGEKVSDTSDLTGINELYAHWVKDPGKVEVIDPKTDDTTKELEPKLEVEDSTVKNLLTKDENDLVQKGDDADVYLTVLEGKDDKEIDLAKAKLGTYEFGQALDITLNIKVGNNTPRKISDSKDEVSITIDIPEDLINKDSSKTRTYYMIRVHDGKAEYLNDVTYNKANNTLTFKSRYFSTYVIAYRDTDNPKPSANTGHHVSCEEYMNSNNWTWSEKSQKCVFKVSNTGTK